MQWTATAWNGAPMSSERPDLEHETRTDGQAQPPGALVRAARRLLAPLVKLLLAHGATHAFVSELLKRVYLEVAERELARGGERVSASRLSVLTGLHRKDIRRLREPQPEYAPPSSVSLGARLIARWTGEAEFCDAEGRARPLPRQAERGPSFEGLVASVSTDVRPRAVLDEWLRLGLVEVDAEDRVALRAEAFVPSEGFDEKAHFLGRNLHDHLAAAANNVSGDRPMLERSAHYRGLGDASVSELEALSERLGMEALRALDRRARELQREDAAEAPEDAPRQRINFGVFFYRGPEGPDGEPEGPDSEARDEGKVDDGDA